MNVHDSRRIEEVLLIEGYEPTNEATLADLIVVNTCSVREKAEHKLMSLLGTLRPLKDRPGVVLAVAGCVAQQEGERLIKKAPFVDLVFGPDNIVELPSLLERVQQEKSPITRTEFDLDAPQFLHAKPRPGAREVCAYVTVMKGCDERCTFCVVPYTRGQERYRSADSIVSEIQGLVAGGVREVTLLGQTVNSWYDPSDVDLKPLSKRVASTSRFAHLLRRIAEEVPLLKRLRYTSPHPRHVTDALVHAHSELAVLPSHVHLPMQSGSDAVLKRMARRYTSQEYIDRAQALLGAREKMTLSTDIIVGFPGETEEDFQKTLDVVATVGFVAAFCFKYSPRPYTPALHMEDDVSEAIKSDRLARLFALIETQQSTHLRSLVDTQQRVLVEASATGDENRFTGRTDRNEIVHLAALPGVDPIGQVVKVDCNPGVPPQLRGYNVG